MAPRGSDYYDHPVFRPNRLRLKTQALKDLSDELHRWLWTGVTGAVITGHSRVGKTTALRMLASALHTRDGVQIPVYHMSMPTRDQGTVTAVFKQLCLTAGMRITGRDTADSLSDRYVHYLVDNAVKRACQYAVLFVDEMQRLTPLQFGPFAELDDHLQLFDIVLTSIFIGNDQESSELLNQVENPRYAHIHGRFFTQRFNFRGLTSSAQVKFCLAQYDTLCYPVGGPTYTGYFLPKEFGAGWRFSGLSADVWRVFHDDYQRPYHIDSWGMQYFTAAVNTLLTDFLPSAGVDQFDDDMFHECIRISSLIPELVRHVP